LLICVTSASAPIDRPSSPICVARPEGGVDDGGLGLLALLFDGGGCELVEVGALRNVRGHRDGFAAGFADLGDHRVEPVGAACREHHLGAACGQVARHGFADAAARAGDDGDLALDVVLNGCHGKFLSGCVEEVHAVWKIQAFQ
jgi:hypothetical protein